jgi:hypothetical protein
MPRKRKRTLVAVDPHHLMAVITDEVRLRPNKPNWTIGHQLTVRTAKRDALGDGLPSSYVSYSG